jgi:hypothetical protein
MTPADRPPSRDDVLNAFAVEPDTGGATLERYLRQYPQYAIELVDLSRELARPVTDDQGPLSAEDEAFLETAWKRHLSTAPGAVADPFSRLSISDARRIAEILNIPRQVLAALREHRVIVASIPRGFLDRLAALIGSTAELLGAALALPSASLVRSHKSDEKPQMATQVTFEQLLIDAGVPADKRTSLMSDDN